MPIASLSEEEITVQRERFRAEQMRHIPAEDLEPFPEKARPLYYNPIFPAGRIALLDSRRPMQWRQGGRIGQIRPLNRYQETVIRRHLERPEVGGAGAADKWKGDTLPNGRTLSCACGFVTGNLDANLDHQARYPDHGKTRKAS